MTDSDILSAIIKNITKNFGNIQEYTFKVKIFSFPADSETIVQESEFNCSVDNGKKYHILHFLGPGDGPYFSIYETISQLNCNETYTPIIIDPFK